MTAFCEARKKEKKQYTILPGKVRQTITNQSHTENSALYIRTNLLQTDDGERAAQAECEGRRTQLHCEPGEVRVSWN